MGAVEAKLVKNGESESMEVCSASRKSAKGSRTHMNELPTSVHQNQGKWSQEMRRRRSTYIIERRREGLTVWPHRVAYTLRTQMPRKGLGRGVEAAAWVDRGVGKTADGPPSPAAQEPWVCCQVHKIANYHDRGAQ